MKQKPFLMEKQQSNSSSNGMYYGAKSLRLTKATVLTLHVFVFVMLMQSIALIEYCVQILCQLVVNSAEIVTYLFLQSILPIRYLNNATDAINMMNLIFSFSST